jgi:hypothetical protein
MSAPGGCGEGAPGPCAAEASAFLALVERAVSAGRVGRFAHGAELSARAAARAEELYGGASVIAAEMHCAAAKCLYNRAAVDDVEDPVAFAVAAFDALLRAVAHLTPRLRDGTLLPGRCRAEEARFWADAFLARERPTRGAPAAAAAAAERRTAAAAGYIAAVSAAEVALNSVATCVWPQRLHPQADVAERFLLSVLGLMASATGLEGSSLKCEAMLASRIADVDRRRLEPSFAAALFGAWEGEALRGVRRGRMLLDDPIVSALAAALTLASEAAAREADVAARGLRACALPSCGAQETSVREFKRCGACKAAAYCCAEHAAQHWALAPGGHKRECVAARERHAQQAPAAGGEEPRANNGDA